MKKLKWLLVILGLLLALGIGFHRQLRNLWVNLTFPLTEHTERYVCTCGGHLHADYAPQGFSEELL